MNLQRCYFPRMKPNDPLEYLVMNEKRKYMQMQYQQLLETELAGLKKHQENLYLLKLMSNMQFQQPSIIVAPGFIPLQVLDKQKKRESCSAEEVLSQASRCSSTESDENFTGPNSLINSGIQIKQPQEKINLSPSSEGQAISPSEQEPNKKKKYNVCGHPERKHYAKKLCSYCYHKYGRDKKPWKCDHERLYAHGYCQNCYANEYHKRKKMKTTENYEDTGDSSAKEVKEPSKDQEEKDKPTQIAENQNMETN